MVTASAPRSRPKILPYIIACVLISSVGVGVGAFLWHRHETRVASFQHLSHIRQQLDELEATQDAASNHFVALLKTATAAGSKRADLSGSSADPDDVITAAKAEINAVSAATAAEPATVSGLRAIEDAFAAAYGSASTEKLHTLTGNYDQQQTVALGNYHHFADDVLTDLEDEDYTTSTDRLESLARQYEADQHSADRIYSDDAREIDLLNARLTNDVKTLRRQSASWI